MNAIPFLLGLEIGSLPQQLVNGVLLGAIYALIALGYTMVYGVLRLINFAHGEVFMLGAYVALFVSRWAGGSTKPLVAPSSILVVSGVLIGLGVVFWVASARIGPRSGRGSFLRSLGYGLVGLAIVGAVPAMFQPGAINLVLMLLASMSVCALVGVIIERAAYRPMRSQPRIAVLITAIGVSLLLQYGGQLFLPTEPQPSIEEGVIPAEYRDSVNWTIVGPSPELADRQAEAAAALKEARSAVVNGGGTEAESELTEVVKNSSEIRSQVNAHVVRVTVPKGQLIMLFTALTLMLLLRHLVLHTAAGRAMRAVSHDMDSASLMGISVDRTVTLTFVLGSALAGAGAMMNATFLGTPLDTFYGLQPGVKAFIAAVLGGIGNIPGAALGGLLMGIAETSVVALGFSELKDAVAFVILIAVLLFRPGGLLGSSKVEKV